MSLESWVVSGFKKALRKGWEVLLPNLGKRKPTRVLSKKVL